MQRVLYILYDAVHALPAVQASWLSPLGATVCMLKHPVIAPTFHLTALHITPANGTVLFTL